MKYTLKHSINSHIPAAGPDESVAQVLDRLKNQPFEDGEYVFITDSAHRLLGCVQLMVLLRTDPEVRMEALTHPCKTIDISTTLEYAASYAIREKIQSVPVTNTEGTLLGVLTAQTIIETLRREHIDDMHKIAGIRKEISSANLAIIESPIRSVWHRLPWLLTGLIGSFVATFIMTRYESMLGETIALAFFIPGIVYLADAIGTQTETIVIRGLSLSWTAFKTILQREFITGWMIGMILGLLSLPAALAGGYDLRISLVVCLSIMVAGILATTIGLLLPWLLQKAGKDPAFGSGPLATIIQDILSIFVYLMIAKAVLGGI